VPKRPPQDRPTTKLAQREATNETLIGVARTLFARHGYAHTGTEDIVRAAQVTRGALYYHFKNKEDLFKAVLERVQVQIADRIEVAASGSDDLQTQLRLGCRAFLEICLEPDVQRIALIDAPSVVGWSVWREYDAAHAMKSLRTGLEALEIVPLDATTHLLSGAMNEAALWIAQSDTPARALEEADAVIQRLLGMLVVPGHLD
jgi:AcrR family transcriptional regulator